MPQLADRAGGGLIGSAQNLNALEVPGYSHSEEMRIAANESKGLK